MSKKSSWKKILLILGGLILLAIIIGIIVGLITNSESKSGSTGTGPPCKNIGDNCSTTSGEECCDSNAICTLDSTTKQSTCQFVDKCIKSGEKCIDAPGLCCANLYCNTSQNKCTQCTSIGASCTLNVYGDDSCCDNLYCDNVYNICKQCTSIGDKCETDEQCCDSASCNQSKCCQKNKHKCTQAIDCCSNYCHEGICNCKPSGITCKPNPQYPECCANKYCDDTLNECTECTNIDHTCQTDEECCGSDSLLCSNKNTIYCDKGKCTKQTCKDWLANCTKDSDCCEHCKCEWLQSSPPIRGCWPKGTWMPTYAPNSFPNLSNH
jgi:hypothetical protein